MTSDFRVGPWLVKPSLNIISRNGTTLRLEPKVMEVLLCLAGHAGEALPKETLLQTVWPDTFVSEDVLKRCISELRRAFEDDAREPRIIETIAKRGYRLVAPVEMVKGTQGPPAPAASSQTSNAPAGSRIPLSRRHLWIGAAIGGAVVITVFLSALRASRSAGATASASIRSLAVLPLQNLSNDPAQEYFSDGMTDALITEISHIDSVRVISRTSSMQYKQTRKSLREIAGELNVDGIIEGTVQRSGDRVRITTQLIQASSDKHLWANAYERDLHDVFALEQEVTRDIADQVRARITTQNQPAPDQPRPVNLKALDAYLQGNYHMNRASNAGPHDEEVRRAGLFFQHSIDADPAFAPAYIGLAETHHNLWSSSSGDLEMMKSAANRALELAPASSEARQEVAAAKEEEWDWSGAEEEYRKAITLNPNNAAARDEFGGLLDAIGRLEEGWKQQELAQELDPATDHLSWALYRRGDYDRAIERLRTTLQTLPAPGGPDQVVFHWLLSEIYAQKGMHKEWLQELSESATLLGMPELAGRLQRTFATSGYLAARRLWASELEQWAATKQGYLPGIVAQVYASLGDNDRAFRWLQQGCEHYRDQGSSDPILEWTKIDSSLAPLRSDPRFKDVLHCMGLP